MYIAGNFRLYHFGKKVARIETYYFWTDYVHHGLVFDMIMYLQDLYFIFRLWERCFYLTSVHIHFLQPQHPTENLTIPGLTTSLTVIYGYPCQNNISPSSTELWKAITRTYPLPFPLTTAHPLPPKIST